MRLLILGDLMKSFRVAVFLKFGESVGWGKGYLQAAPRLGATPGNAYDMAAVLSVAEQMQAECTGLGLSASVATCRKLAALAHRERVPFAAVKKLEDELHGRIVDETQEMVLLAVDPGRAEQFRGGQLFGDDVARAFPSSKGDIDEAGKCLALDRGTACVFHLMRILEIGLQLLAAKLGISLAVDRNWQAILNDVNGAVKKLPSSSRNEKETLARYSEAAISLQHVKDAWRNDVMHPRDVYTVEQATDVLDSTKKLMRSLTQLV